LVDGFSDIISSDISFKTKVLYWVEITPGENIDCQLYKHSLWHFISHVIHGSLKVCRLNSGLNITTLVSKYISTYCTYNI